MASKLFETEDRDQAHAKLEQILAKDSTSTAECREDRGAGIYQVWDGPEAPPVSEPATLKAEAEPEVSVKALVEQALNALADDIVGRVGALLDERLGKK